MGTVCAGLGGGSRDTNMHPDFARVVGDHDFGRPVGGAPVAFHDEIPADGQFASLADGEDLGPVGWTDYLRLHVR